MTFHFNLHRFGVDEFAVGNLINGDLPDDDDERWRMLDAPCYHIQKLLDEHLRTQALFRDCRESGKPFALYLRSFGFEHRSDRRDGNVISQVSTHVFKLQEWLRDGLAGVGVPLVRLHGGSDGFMSDMGDSLPNILSTHACNWKAVAAELIQSAAVIILVISELTPGVLEELELIVNSGKRIVRSCC